MSHGPICGRCGRMGEHMTMTEHAHKLLKAIFDGEQDVVAPGETYTQWPARDETYEPWPEHMRMNGIVCVHCQDACEGQPSLGEVPH
ncbi:MAG: hypothetical protein V3W37_10015 [Candidatus Binatia bacterium]